MPLVKCPECEQKVSQSARYCPHCGYEESMNHCATRTMYPCFFAKYVFGFMIVAILFFLLGKAVRTVV